jgi:hypothetical protein
MMPVAQIMQCRKRYMTNKLRRLWEIDAMIYIKKVIVMLSDFIKPQNTSKTIADFKVIIHFGPSHYYNYEVETVQCELFCILYKSALYMFRPFL